jgi:hypothetical protein
MPELIPAPAPDASSDPQQETGSPDSGSPRHGGYRRPKHAPRPIPNVDELLGMILDLNGAVMFGLVSTAKGNLMHRNLRAVLDAQMRRAQGDETVASAEDLVELCRRDPQALNILERFLSDEQIEWLMARIKEAGHDQA